MCNGFKDWKLKINKSLDTPYGIHIVLLAVICLGIIVALTIKDSLSTSQDELVKRSIQKVTYEGHDYLIYQTRGICHSPNCRCYGKGSTE